MYIYHINEQVCREIAKTNMSARLTNGTCCSEMRCDCVLLATWIKCCPTRKLAQEESAPTVGYYYIHVAGHWLFVWCTYKTVLSLVVEFRKSIEDL
jgi:hypothetical protein